MDETIIKKTYNFFVESEITDYYKCVLCHDKKKPMNGKQPTNLTKHLRKAHTEIYEAEVKHVTQDDIELKIERLKLLQNFVEITTVNKEPFNVLLKSGVKKLAAEKLKMLKAAGLGIDLNDKNLPEIKLHLKELQR